MGSPAIFNGRRTKLLTADGILTSAGRTVDFDGAINYIANSGFEINASGYAAYADAAGPAPVNGTGGSPTVTITRSTSSPLFQLASGLFTHDAANRQGEGFSYDFTIDAGIQTSTTPCTITGFYNVASGTYADGDLTVWIYDVTNGVLIQPSASSILNNIGAAPLQCEFQPNYNSTSYRLIFHVSTTTATAYTMQFDNLSVSPNTYNPGASVTDPVAYTPTFTGFGTVSTSNFKSWRVGAYLYVDGTFTPGTPTATEARITLGFGGVNGGITSDSGLPTLSLAGRYALSANGAYDNTVLIEPGVGYMTMGNGYASGAGLAKANGNIVTGTGVVTSLFAKFKIAGWGTSQVLSSETDTRVVSSILTNSGNVVMAAGTVILDTATKDSHGAYNTTTGVYTVPVPGYYDCKLAGATLTGAGTEALGFLQNAGSNVYVWTFAGTTTVGGGTTQFYANAGDTIKLVGSGAGSSLSAGAKVSITRVSGPAQIAASEKIYLQYTGNAGNALTADVTNVDFTTKVTDSHGAWNGTTFTAPRAGWYDVSGSANFNAAAGRNIHLWVNGSKNTVVNDNGSLSINTLIGGAYLMAGETMTFRSAQAATLSNSSTFHWISITSQG